MDVALLGPVELRTDDGSPVPVAGARLRTLLVLLALNANRVVTSDRLIDSIWSEDPPAGASNALQALISRLRRAGLTIESAPAGYRLTIEPDRVDALRFARLAEEARAVTDPAAAIVLYKAAEHLWRSALDFPEGARAAATRLEEQRLKVVQDRMEGQLDHGEAAGLIPELQELAEAHPLHEPLAALLIRALTAAGRPGKALEVYEQTRKGLAETLGADPSPALADLHLELLRATPRGNLPAEVSSFVGREHDVRAVRELIARHRLVTLTGPGGSGKTRLSVEVGRAVDAEVWRVELAPVTDPAEIPQTILTTLGLRGQVQLGRPLMSEPASPLTRLCDALAGRELLLVLDNCEHLIAEAAVVADGLLRAAPRVRLLATSREPLGIPGERLWPVEPLALPPDGADPAGAGQFPAVRLLLDRAGAVRVRPDESVVRICRALDGMPLAIELAAARLRTLPAEVLADRLADRFRLLTGGSRAARPRHQTLRAVVDWSWDLLSGPERELWQRFSVFHGGAGVAAAERVCGADIELLGALVDKSLLVLGPDGRYRMLETIREYGRERLAESGESELVRRAHADHLLALATAAEPRLHTRDQLIWLRRLADDHDNLHAAVRAAIDAGDRPTALALTARLGWYWWLRGHRAEGARLALEAVALPGDDEDPEDLAVTYTFAALNGLEGASPIEDVKSSFAAADRLSTETRQRNPVLRLLRPLSVLFETASGGEPTSFDALEPLYDDPDPWLRALAKMIAAQLRINFGRDVDRAETEMRESLAGFRAIGERWGIGFALSLLGDLAAGRGDFPTAVSWQREAIALVREVGIREDLPQLEMKLAHQLWLAGEHAEAHRMLEQARLTAGEVALPEVLASVEHGYATIARYEGALEEAHTHMRAALALTERSSLAPQFHATVKSVLAQIEASRGDLPAARALHTEAVAIAVESHDAPVVAQILVAVADYALTAGDPAGAARLLGAAEAVRGWHDRSAPDGERVRKEACAALGDAAFDQAFARGRALTMDEASAAAAAALKG